MSKIPADAECVYRGIIHDVYHWQQKMFDGTTQTFEGLKRKPSVTVIAITADYKILINDEKQPYNGQCLCLPGGVSETDDMLAEARRELREETGFISDDWKFFAKTEVLEYSKLEWESHFYIARNCQQKYKPALDSGEKIFVRSVKFEELIEIARSDQFSNSFITKMMSDLEADDQKLQVFKQEVLGISP